MSESLKKAGAALACATVLNPLIYSGNVVNQSIDRYPSDHEATRQIVFEVIALTPDTNEQLDYTLQDVQESIKDVSTDYSRSTHGAITLAVSSMQQIALEPKGTTEDLDGKITRCYEPKQEEAINSQLRRNKQLGKNAFTMLVYNGQTKNCSQENAAAYVSYPSDGAYAAYNSMSTGIVAHETGHLLGLPHDKQINSILPDGRSVTVFDIALSSSDIYLQKDSDTKSDWLKSRGEPIPEQSQLDKDQEYSGPSVMGHGGSNIFNAAQKAKLVPDMKIMRVGREPGKYPIAFGRNTTVGIEIPLAHNSKLREIDPGIDYITVSVDRYLKKDEPLPDPADRDAIPSVLVTAQTTANFYTIDSPRVFAPPSAMEAFCNGGMINAFQCSQPVPYPIFYDQGRWISIEEASSGKLFVRIDDAVSYAPTREVFHKQWEQRLQILGSSVQHTPS